MINFVQVKPLFKSLYFYEIELRELLRHVANNRPVSQLNSIRGKRCDSLNGKKSTSYHYVATSPTKQCHALLRAMHALETKINMISRQVMFLEEFQ